MLELKLMLRTIGCLGLLGLAACAGLPTEREASLDQGEEPSGYYERGKYYLGKGYNGLALNQFTLALRENPGHIPILNAAAITYQRLQRPDMAEEIFRKALLLDPTSAQTLNNVGYFHLTEGDPREALKFFEAASEHEGYGDIARSNMARATLALENEARVMQASLSSVEAVPVEARFLENVSLERMSHSVYMLNTKRNPVFENAVVHLKLDPRLIVRSAYME
ncbi:tetratricopeptide repeat protein [Sneathiella chinensis]|uniref:Tetratricopeptide repeat protein n=1 Tax=Sneathiella chinensis TaxID=349750 RepID=A0ABQ5TZM5_9PROT|nr:tetratricopeptide repeat protein [Sneathiella chinensis]GLQ05069.1 hypothetical protein GCM10007924_02900 [Sneathiella chinensis]